MPAKIYKNFLGFTMIELLIVIAVLGILAVAVLSAINPIEQINRAADTGSRSDAEQLISAIDRYYANNAVYPWQAGSASSQMVDPWKVADNAWLDDAGAAVLAKLTTTGTEELKQAFIDRINVTLYNDLMVYNSGDPGESTYICFHPKSASFKTAANTRCLTPPGDFPASACPAAPDFGWSCLP